jgi:uncharacterized glyoxalase superfamily protein PhnB
LNIQQIDIVTVPVTNQQAALAFYTEKLGFEVRLQMPYMDPSSLWIEVAPPNGTTRLVLATWMPHLKTGEFTGIVLITTNIKADYMELKSKGVTMTPLDKQAWGTSTMISDPDGNQLVLQQNTPFPG